MKVISRLISAASAVLVAGFLAGCSSNPSLSSTSTAENLEPGKFQPLMDMPIPSDAKLNTEQSLILGPSDHWIGRAVLKVGMPPNDTTVFYQNQMPSFGWDLITVVQGKVSSLTFAKTDRIASVQIESATLTGSVVTIIMSPRQPKQEPPKSPTQEPPKPKPAP
ncbi:MAG TPA: hypothetical protein VK460_08860 [Burkholderiales bacterium]|nr:hypothetical protein [Burkholderiales bacterium]